MTPEEQVKQEEIRRTAQTVQELIRSERERFELEHLPLTVRMDMTEERESNLRRQRLVLKPKIDFLKKTLQVLLDRLSPAERESGELGRALKQLQSQRERLAGSEENIPSAIAEATAETKAGTTNPAMPPGGFEHSEDYTSVIIRGEPFTLTSRQAQVIEILHEEYTRGTPDVGTAFILEKINCKTSRLRDIFRSRPAARKALVKSFSKGTVRLNL
jgi:hypothetical protein